MVFDTYAQARAFAARELLHLQAENPGWSSYEYDLPEYGEIGIRLVLDNTLDFDGTFTTSEERDFAFLPFGKVEPEVVLPLPSKDLDQVMACILSMMAHRAFSYDCVKTRTMGCVHYDTPGKATLLRLPLTLLKVLHRGPSVAQSKVDWIDAVPTIWMSTLPSLRSVLDP